VQLLPNNPPAYCPRCEGKQENGEVETMAWQMGNLLYVDKLRKNADPNFRKKGGKEK